MCYNQMAHGISAGKVCLLGLFLMLLTLFHSIHQAMPSSQWCCLWCFWSPRPGIKALTQALDVVLLIMFWYLPLSTFPTGQWTTKSIQSDSVPDTWGLMQGLCGASCHRGRPGKNLVSRDITPSVTEDKSANPTLMEKGFLLWLRKQRKAVR